MISTIGSVSQTQTSFDAKPYNSRGQSRNQLLQKLKDNQSQTQAHLDKSLKALNNNTHEKFQHELSVKDGEVEKRYSFIQNLTQKLNQDPCYVDESSKEADETNDMFNQMARSIVQRNIETQNIIELNQSKFTDSPYHLKRLKIQPKIIYVKDSKEQIIMLSEKKKSKKSYSTSHNKLYGGSGINQYGHGHIKKKLEVNLQSKRGSFKNTDNSRYNVLLTMPNQDILIPQQKKQEVREIKEIKYIPIQDEISREEKVLIKKAMILQKKQIAFQTFRSMASQSMDMRSPQQTFNQSISQYPPDRETRNQNQVIPAAVQQRVARDIKAQNSQVKVTQQQINEQMKELGINQKRQALRQNSCDQSQSVQNQSWTGETTGSLTVQVVKPEEKSPFLRRARYSVVTVENSENNQLKKKIAQMRNQALRRIDSLNMQVPEEWRKKFADPDSEQRLQDRRGNNVSQKSLLRSNYSQIEGKQAISAIGNFSSFNAEQRPDGQNLSQTQASSQYNLTSMTKIFQNKKNSQQTERSLPNFIISTRDQAFNYNGDATQSKLSSQREIHTSYLFSRHEPAIASKNQEAASNRDNTYANITPIKEKQDSQREVPTTISSVKFGNFISHKHDLQNQDDQYSLSKTKMSTPMKLPFYNYCRNCNLKNQSFVSENNGKFVRVQRERDGMKMVINGDTFQVIQ